MSWAFTNSFTAHDMPHDSSSNAIHCAYLHLADKHHPENVDRSGRMAGINAAHREAAQ